MISAAVHIENNDIYRCFFWTPAYLSLIINMDDVPKDYLKPSAARENLASRMFGGLSLRQDIIELKRKLPRLRVRPGAWQETAAKRLREATVAGKISVYLWQASSVAASETSQPLKLSPVLVRRLLLVRSGIPDHPYRVQRSLLRDGLVTPELFAALQTGILVYRREEFECWCRSERRRRIWPSQRSSEKPKQGAPTKRSNRLRSRIVAEVERGTWMADQPVMSLYRILTDKGPTPSHDTITRLVDELYLETGDQRYRRVKHRRRSR